ncbi:uncharacterized protein LOC117592434 [Drosophila guanche]|uniref:Uncharacterized protein n=1 Tax=Drosophila guanche TaxID=7266 RepID=A0A3B0J4K0_DROGU|nr:uncharacterized protein LOC117592434 [Drosophila guanche]SPP74453.1 Hypothetical predicted protein [Drosophila guanche]
MGRNDKSQQGSAACASDISYVQCQNLKYNVIILGWLGVIISSVTLGSSILTLHMHPDIGVLLKQGLLSIVTDKEQQFLMNLLTIFSSVVYGLSLINAAVSLLLLIGVARDTSCLLYPWLIFHGLLYGFGLYLGVFYATLGLFIDLSSFLMCLLVFTLVLVIFYKIYHEVFTLLRVMGEQAKYAPLGGVFYKDVEHGWTAAGVPCQQVYVPLKQ